MNFTFHNQPLLVTQTNGIVKSNVLFQSGKNAYKIDILVLKFITMKNDEYFDIIDSTGKIVGKATREECHSNKSLAHRTVHILVFNSKGELFLQKRSMDKDIQPGKWDTSVGGHLNLGETVEEAIYREMKEELDIEGVPVKHLYDYWWHSEVETEFVHTYTCIYDGQITVDTDEIADGRFWRLPEIESNLGSGMFTPNFEEEYKKYLKY